MVEYSSCWWPAEGAINFYIKLDSVSSTLFSIFTNSFFLFHILSVKSLQNHMPVKDCFQSLAAFTRLKFTAILIFKWTQHSMYAQISGSKRCKLRKKKHREKNRVTYSEKARICLAMSGSTTELAEEVFLFCWISSWNACSVLVNPFFLKYEVTNPSICSSSILSKSAAKPSLQHSESRISLRTFVKPVRYWILRNTIPESTFTWSSRTTL